MEIKYLFLVENEKIAVKFNDISREGMIGGFCRNRDIIIHLLEYFVEKVPKMKYIQKNKVRFNFRMSLKTFDMKISMLEENGFAFEKVKSFGRLTR